jgi:hypothetical protein
MTQEIQLTFKGERQQRRWIAEADRLFIYLVLNYFIHGRIKVYFCILYYAWFIDEILMIHIILNGVTHFVHYSLSDKNTVVTRPVTIRLCNSTPRNFGNFYFSSRLLIFLKNFGNFSFFLV